MARQRLGREKPDEEPDLEVLTESALAMAQATIQSAMDQADISKADLARSMDRPRSFITRMLSGSHNLTVKTMAKAILACGYEIKFGLTSAGPTRARAGNAVRHVEKVP